VKDGATKILVVPYFLAPGYFVKVSLPKCLAEAQAEFPEVTFRTAEPIGYDVRLADALIASAKTAQTAEHWRDELKQATAFCRDNPQCPLYETPDCPHTPQQTETAQ
jgi:sirohydrochlorin ferrochelatase